MRYRQEVQAFEIRAFVEARLDEDEQVARAATAGPWEVGGDSIVTERGGHLTQVGSEEADRWVAGVWPVPAANTTHIARHDPARVLREVEAKRRIVAEHTKREPAEAFEGQPAGVLVYCPLCRNDGDCPTLRALASAYADHPDYREEWRP